VVDEYLQLSNEPGARSIGKSTFETWRIMMLANDTETKTEMTREQMLARISALSDEMDANDEENRMMQAEIDSLYAKVDAMKMTASTQG
jgi:hypothetical protein